MGICVGLPAKNKQAPELDPFEFFSNDIPSEAPLVPLTSDEDRLPDHDSSGLPGPLPMMTPRLSRQSAFSRASMELPLPFSPQNRSNGGDNLDMSYDDEDDDTDDVSIVSPSVGRSPFEFEFDADDDTFVQKLLNNRNYTDFLCDKDQKKTLDKFKCSYCGHILQDPVILVPCGHEFCRECLFKWKTHFHDQPEVPCPECSTAVYNQWFTPAIRSKTYMTQKKFRCKCIFSPQCKTHIPICRYKQHLKKCEYATVTMEIKTFSSQKSISLEMRKTASARECIDEIINKYDDFDDSEQWYLHIGSPGLIADDSSTVQEFFKRKNIWIGSNAGS